MFRKVRKIKNEIEIGDCYKLLSENKRGVISFNGENNYPYSIPINYYYDEDENRLYFHCGKKGYKIDCINNDNKACFVTYGNETLSEDGWSYYVSSVVIFGKTKIVEDRDIILENIKKFAMKYYPNEKEADEEIKEGINAVSMFVLDIEHISGKRVRER